ncbi:hypothetical protein Aph01nite_43980 [Acrocarpospora phusangensis]|uniref:TNase-like domain-containing protein n=1 Tax=Acrocarpospora phusangensis TaxID=1070424 RepID=A0A919UQ63_9ACTN|nr:thermonuclease family protein [Acrocarpospora phusangensis]GIH26088.1 hypothetical protein Aph01nite_43980 [Acrocarpospora phusangensis]
MRLLPRALAILASVALLVPISAATPAGAAARPKSVPKAAILVKIKKIVDGDTVDVTYKSKTLRVRLLEIDAPERGKCWYKTATARTAALLPVGKGAYVLRDKDPKDQYGRYLFYIWNAGGTFVNRNLVRYGYAKAVLYKPNDKYIKVMRADQAKAKAERLRIWSDKCDGTAGSGGSGSTPTPKPTPSPSPSGGGGGNDPRFGTCREANDAGYGPYRRGVDPEYDWYQDRDGDGVVCER